MRVCRALQARPYLSLLLLALLPGARGALNAIVWPTTAFAPPAAGAASVVPAVGPAGVPAAAGTVRLTGTIAAPATETLGFVVTTDGGVRLWIDDHLVVDDGDTLGRVRAVKSFLNVSFFAGVPQPFRLDYSHVGAAPEPELALAWVGNVTALAPVPAGAFTTAVTPAEAQRVALRDRLTNPVDVPWQTYDNPTMGGHVLMPTGFSLYATLADDANATLGDIFVFRRSKPAVVFMGAHSFNGSDYTSLRIDAWQQRPCSVTFETTVVARELYFLARANGSACASLRLLVAPRMLWSRAGAFAGGGAAGALTATLPGFPDVTAHAVGAAPAPFPGEPHAWALPLGGGAAVGYCTGPVAVAPAAMADAIAAAGARAAAIADKHGAAVADVYQPIQTIISWNTMFTPYEGVVTPVSRGWDFGSGYVLFDWDNYFLAYMTATDAESRDLAYSNIIQTCLMRTMEGFVPNFASGPHVSFDRTEPQVGARVVLEVFKKWGDAWLVDVVFDALASWNDWVWSHRRGEGVYAGPDGHADLIVLGSDPNASPGGVDGGENTMQAARYESGLDNSPQYDGPDKDSQGSGPVTFDNTTHHMQLYDVGMTALFLSDTEALIALARATGRGAAVPALQARFDAVAAALNAHLWDDAAGMYTNKLFNGSFYARYSPTSFFPLISGAAPPDRAAAMMRLAAAPEGFCLNTSHTPDADALMLVDWWDGKHDNWAAATTQSNVDAVNSGAYNFIRVEASVLGPAAGPGAGRVPLFSWYSSAADDYALTNSSTPPAAGYALVRPEGYCFAGAPPGGGWPTTPLTLWYSAARRDYQTCGTAKCESDATAAKYDPRGTMCTAWDATLPFNAPCKFGCNSIARGDAAWQDGTFNNYWRGRIWGPHVQLVYWGLARPEYAAVPGVAAARAALLAQGRALLSQEWINLRQITENYNGLVGYGEDVGNADPAYTWGALPGFITLLEQGIF